QVRRVDESVKFAVCQRFHPNNLTAKNAKYTKTKLGRLHLLQKETKETKNWLAPIDAVLKQAAGSRLNPQPGWLRYVAHASTFVARNRFFVLFVAFCKKVFYRVRSKAIRQNRSLRETSANKIFCIGPENI